MQETIDPLVISGFSSLIAAGAPRRISCEQRRFLRELPDVFSAERVGLYLLDEKCSPRSIFISSGGESSDRFLSEYEQLRSKDPVFRYLRKFRNAMDGSTLLGREGWMRHRLHQWLLTWGLGHTLQGAIICKGKLFGTLNVARALGKQQFSLDEIEDLSHLCQKIAISVTASTDAKAPLSVGKPQCCLQPRVVTDGMGQPQLFGGFDSDGFSLYKTYSELISHNIQTLKTTGNTVVQMPVYCDNQGQNRALLTTVLIPGREDAYLTTLLPLPISDNNDQSVEALEELSPRTKMVAELLLKGYPNKLIAKELVVSENTIKDHIKRIYD
ncbi:MAG: LuxR C-terminal-related transcriptional regulator [Proteobacteria bacterium]|nr:LuxR C-terminal-related transcriptional regulator [Pseudomonadota bacterium]